MGLETFEQNIAKVRYISVIAVVALGFGSLLMFLIGAVKIIRAYATYFALGLGAQTGSSGASSVAIAYVVQAIDAFLIALVLFIFGAGIYNLFVRNPQLKQTDTQPSTKIQNIYQLKSILAELVIIILMVKFLEGALRNFGSYEWEMLVLPVGVLMLAAAVNLLKLKH
jgi:uncharacterized membrane protein YqhA